MLGAQHWSMKLPFPTFSGRTLQARKSPDSARRQLKRYLQEVVETLAGYLHCTGGGMDGALAAVADCCAVRKAPGICDGARGVVGHSFVSATWQFQACSLCSRLSLSQVHHARLCQGTFEVLVQTAKGQDFIEEVSTGSTGLRILL